MQQRRTAMLPTLLGWYYSNFPVPDVLTAINISASWAIENGNLEVLQMCDMTKARLVRHCHNTCRNFKMACKLGHTTIIQYFLQTPTMRKCKHQSIHDHTAIALRITALHGWLVAARMLLDSGADVNSYGAVEDWRAGTPLQCAVRGKHVDMVVLLLAHGARVPGRKGRSRSLHIHKAVEEQGGDMARIITAAMQEQQARSQKSTGKSNE